MLEYQMEKLRQGSTERKELEDGLITKQRDRKGKECSSIIKAELPKLIMTRFSGTHNDWIKFWNQFEAEMDKSNWPSISKFSYLKEILEPKLCLLVDGLTFKTKII